MNREEFNQYTGEIKEVIENMPRNNKKNRSNYVNYVKEQLDSFSSLHDEIIKDIHDRYQKILAKEKRNSVSFDDKNKKLEELFGKLHIFNSWNTPYEKLELDRIIFEINHYYKDNLDALNEDIRDAIECFHKVGVVLKVDDFCYSSYVYQYMSVILGKEEDSKVIKKRLDEVYWKSPNVMKQIACNFNYLYYKYEKYFIQYYHKLEKDMSYDKVSCEYNDIILEERKDRYEMDTIISLILNETINIKDYSEEKLKTYKDSISHGDVDVEHYLDLYSSLEEYKVYKEYSFIVSKIKELYQNKAQYKNVYKNLRKEISKIESKLFKVNKKISFQNKFFHNKDKVELLELEVSALTDSLIEKYHEIHFSKVNEIISGMNDSVSYYDILKLVSSFYIYFRELMVENQEGISFEEVIDKRLELSKFLYKDNLHFLPNVSVMEEVNIPQIIADKYQLLNIHLNVDDIDSNVDGYLELINKIMIASSVKESNITYEELLFQTNCKDIIDKI